MAAPLSQPLNQAAWRGSMRKDVDRALAGWLTETGLLTHRLRELCGTAFRLDVLTEAGAASGQSLRREVLLCCADEPCIYALTEIPPGTLERHAWLSQLGAASLGETLRRETAEHGTMLSRSEFEFAELEVTQLPAAVATRQQRPAWARRSLFRLNEDLLTVTEVFLHGLLECERRHVRAAS